MHYIMLYIDNMENVVFLGQWDVSAGEGDSCKFDHEMDSQKPHGWWIALVPANYPVTQTYTHIHAHISK